MFKKTLFLTIMLFICISIFSFSDEEKNTISLYLGDTINLKTYIKTHSLNINLSNHTRIQNANPQVIKIDDKFNLKATSVGETMVVLVHNNDLTPIIINVKSPIKSIKMNVQDVTLLVGEIFPFEYELVPDEDYQGKLNTQLKWQSSKNNIAGVKGKNRIYTHGVGTTTLTATAYDNTTSISINVTVIGNPNPLIIKPDVFDSNVMVGEKRQLKAFFLDKDVSSHIEWTPEFPDLLSIDDDGLVTPLREGTCEVTATSSISFKKDYYTFFIHSMVDSIHLDQSTVTLKQMGEQVQLNVTLKAKDPQQAPLRKGYYFTSSNPDVASVDNKGLVTAKGSGIALINVIAYDSGKKDSCTIEIPHNPPLTSINHIFIKDVTLKSYPQEILIGQKVLMDYKLTPENATNKTPRFHVRNGSEQIHLINGEYYFVPNKRGSTQIKIVADSEGSDSIEDIIDVSVISPIASLDMDLALKRGKKSERHLYIGEKTELITKIFTQGLYTPSDVYPNTLKYTVKDPDIAKLTYENGKYFLTALRKGTTSVHVANSEDKHNNYLKISVLTPVKKINTDKTVKLPIEIPYTPRITFTPKKTTKENFKFDISKGLNLSVEKFYLSKNYVSDEIAYEKELINHFSRLQDNPVLMSTINRHKERLDRLIALERNSSTDYCLITNSLLKDRNFNNYTYYTIHQNHIVGHYPGKALVNISIDNTASYAQTTMHWTGDKNIFSIQETSKWKDYKSLITEYSFDSILSNLPAPQKIEYMIFYLSNPSLFTDSPSFKLLDAFMSLEISNLPASLLCDLNAATTKQELALIATYLDDEANSLSELELNNIIYYDVTQKKVKNAIAKGFVTPISKDYLGVNKHITYEEFIQTLNKVNPNNKLPKQIQSPLTHKQVLILLNDFTNSY